MHFGRVVAPIEGVRHQIHLFRVRLKEHLGHRLLFFMLGLRLHFTLSFGDKVFPWSVRGRLSVPIRARVMKMSDIDGQSFIVEVVSVELEELDEQLPIRESV